jgi:AraC family transcriptional regulator of adaptative response/methylated-DNA-[protein]-cysteine methyltransferase
MPGWPFSDLAAEGTGWLRTRRPSGLIVAASDRGVCHVRFADDGVDPEEELAREFPFAELRENPVRLEPWSDALVRYVDGRSTQLEVPLDVSGSRFQRRVWAALRGLPRGDTRSYSELAASLGVPRGARAVARACATNPVAVAIPCHRVVAKSGELGGYRWGLRRKRALLEREKDRPGGVSHLHPEPQSAELRRRGVTFEDDPCRVLRSPVRCAR